VLIVEDDPLVRTFVRFALDKGGMGAFEADDGAEALACLGEHRPRIDAVLIDGLLPDMHGVALANRLLDDPGTADLPICFLSGAVHGRTVATAGFGCLLKPVRPTQLVSHIQRLLDWSSAGGSPVEERRTALRALQNGFLVGP